jgi:hypothetical protein
VVTLNIPVKELLQIYVCISERVKYQLLGEIIIIVSMADSKLPFLQSTSYVKLLTLISV